MSQRRFIQEITQKLPSNVGVSFNKQKNPIEVGFVVDGYGNFRVEWIESI